MAATSSPPGEGCLEQMVESRREGRERKDLVVCMQGFVFFSVFSVKPGDTGACDMLLLICAHVS